MGLFFLVAAGFSSFAFSSCYLTKQGWSLLQQRRNAVSADDLTRDPGTAAEIRSLLERVERIRRFGIVDMGLKDTGNYRQLVEIPQDYLVTVVSACRPLSFERYTWWFPFFGSSPYLGFFDEADARAESDRLKAEGWETWVRRVDAFSTLGVLKDPLYSFMAKYSEYRLANLILHEQTHATIWANGHFDFNEQLATFMGDRCALDYVGHEYGPDSTEYRAVGDQDADQQTFYDDLAGLREQLSAIYATKNDNAEKEDAKFAAIRSWQAGFAATAAQRYRTRDYDGLATMKINNAFLDLYQTYTGRNELFSRMYEAAGTMPEFIRLMKEAARSSNPFTWMEKRLAGD